jgi:hypothetical protein
MPTVVVRLEALVLEVASMPRCSAEMARTRDERDCGQ